MTAQPTADVRSWAPDDLSYRSIMTSADTRWITPVVAQEVSDWLAGKGIAVDVTVDSDLVDGRNTLTARHLTWETSRSLRILLVEPQDDATWTTEIYAADADGQHSWVQLVVRNDRGKFVSRPRIAQSLMRALPLGDGALRSSADPQVFTHRQVPALVDLLVDPRRNGMVFVAATAPDTPLAPFVEMVAGGPGRSTGWGR